MSQKLIEFLVHFSDLYYNVISYFYAEICTIYQIYILQKYIAEMTIPVRIRSESSSMAKARSRQKIEVATKSHIILNGKLSDKREIVETEKGLQRRISCRDTILRSGHRRKTTLVTTDN